MSSEKIAVWLIQLGTPDEPSVSSVRRYLNEFLMDPRMIALPYPLRFFLVKCIIGIFRAPKSAKAYESVWTEKGSPLKVYSQELKIKLQETLGESYSVHLGMRYGAPSLKESWESIKRSSALRCVVIPLFPQYASSSSGSAMEKIFQIVQSEINIPHFHFIPPFYDHPNFIECFAQIAEENQIHEFDHILFSYHGLPEKYVKESGKNCLSSPNCCDAISDHNRFCYRAHCVQTTKKLAKRLNLNQKKYSLGFQSRLGPTKWIQPFSDKQIVQLAHQGVKRLAVLCPSFVADCLETLEEIQIRAQKDFQTAGGTELKLIPSLNAHPQWVSCLADWTKEAFNS